MAKPPSADHDAVRPRRGGARTETKITAESELGSDRAGEDSPGEDRAGMHEARPRGSRKRARVITR